MIQRIKTSNRTATHLDEIQNKLHLSSKAAILRICISLSLNNPESPLDFGSTDSNNGFEISINTLFGDYKDLYTNLIKYHYKESIDEDIFAKLIQSHIERGMIEFYGDFLMSGTPEKMIEGWVNNL